MSIDPGKFGLSPKTVIVQLSKNHFALVIDRKSRVIMSDGRKLLEKVLSIKEIEPDAQVSLHITAPLCSKTKKFLEDHGIPVQSIKSRS